MTRIPLSSLALLAALAVAATPLHAKKPDGDASDLPKGMQKKVAKGGALPPGWEKKLHKGAVLDKAVVDHGKPVSSAIRASLPIGRKGSIDITLDGKVVRLDKATRKVLDVFEVKL